MTRLLLITGAQKSASTSVAAWFSESPRAVLLAPRLPQFGPECLALEGRAHRLRTAALRSRVGRLSASGLVPVMKRPEILHSPALLERAAHAFPDAVAIAILRDPVARSVSAWWHYRHYGLIGPDVRLRDCVTAYERTGNATPAGQVVGFSVYSESVAGLRRLFSRAEVVVNEEVVEAPKAALSRVLEEAALTDTLSDRLPSLNTRSEVARKAPTLPPVLANAVSYRWDTELNVPARRFPGWIMIAAMQKGLLAIGRNLGSLPDVAVTDSDREAVFQATRTDFEPLQAQLGRPVPQAWRSFESDGPTPAGPGAAQVGSRVEEAG